MDTKFGEFLVEGASCDAEDGGGLLYVAAALAENGDDMGAFKLAEGQFGCGGGVLFLAKVGDIVKVQCFLAGEGDGAVHDVAEFPYIARPGVILKIFHGFGFYFMEWMRGLSLEHLEEVFDEFGDVLAVFAEGGQYDFHGIDAVKEVFPKFSGFNGGTKIMVGGGEEPDVNPYFPFATEPSERLVFDDAQDAGLVFEAEVTDFIKKEDAAVGLLEQSG